MDHGLRANEGPFAWAFLSCSDFFYEVPASGTYASKREPFRSRFSLREIVSLIVHPCANKVTHRRRRTRCGWMIFRICASVIVSGSKRRFTPSKGC